MTHLAQQFVLNEDFYSTVVNATASLNAFSFRKSIAGVFPLASSRGVAAEFVRIVASPVVLLANLLAFLAFPVLPAGETAHFKQFKKWLQR